MGPFKVVEALVDETASMCVIFFKTSANTSEGFTPHAMRLFDMKRGLSNECVPLVCVRRSWLWECCVDYLP